MSCHYVACGLIHKSIVAVNVLEYPGTGQTLYNFIVLLFSCFGVNVYFIEQDWTRDVLHFEDIRT